MSDYFISTKTIAEGAELSIYHVPGETQGGLFIPERIIRAQGKTGILGLLSEWSASTVLDGETPVIDPNEELEETTFDQAFDQLENFMSSHTPITPLEVSQQLPEEVERAIGERVKEVLGGLLDVIDTPEQDDEDGPELHTGQYL